MKSGGDRRSCLPLEVLEALEARLQQPREQLQQATAHILNQVSNNRLVAPQSHSIKHK